MGDGCAGWKQILEDRGVGEEKFKSVAMMIQKPQFAKLVKTHTFVTSCFDMVILTAQ